jgi:polar amino acid transport system substrate-binding protein
MKTRRLQKVAVLALCALLLSMVAGCSKSTGSTPAASGGAKSTLQQVVERGTLKVGVILSFPPFGSRNSAGEPEGYDVDLAKEVAKALGVKIEIIDTTAADRIPNLQTGKVDLVIGNFTRTMERAKAIAFTDPYVVAGQVLLVKKGSGIKGISDLTDKTVAVNKSSTADTLITSANPKAKIQRYDTAAAALLAVKQGQADATIEDSNYLAYQAKLDTSLEVTHDSLVPLEYNGFGLRQGDPDWLVWLNQFIFDINASGKNKELYVKWFGKEPSFPLKPAY